MAQGITIDGQWAPSKKALKEAVANSPERVRALATSVFGDEHSGPILDLPKGASVTFAGPDVHYRRLWYGTIQWRGDKLVCT